MRNSTKLLRRLWADDCGAVVSTELVMVLGIVVSGLGAGLATLRNNINRHLIAVSELPAAVIPTAAELQAKVEAPPMAAKSLSHSQSQSAATSHSVSGSHMNVYVNVQIPSRYDPPSP